MYAVIATGGKQYRVEKNTKLRVEKLTAAPGETVRFDQVLLVGGEGAPKIGAPLVKGASVTADVMGAEKGIKTDAVKYKRRKGYHKKIGHRQHYTEVKITGINV
jgi:large subunit ribosomal protein L21